MPGLPPTCPECHLLREPRGPLGYSGLKQEHPLSWMALDLSVSRPLQTNPPTFYGEMRGWEEGSQREKNLLPWSIEY